MEYRPGSSEEKKYLEQLIKKYTKKPRKINCGGKNFE